MNSDNPASWVKWIENCSGSADRFGDTDVVPLRMAREIAARLDECYQDRVDRHSAALVEIKRCEPYGKQEIKQ